MVTVDYRHEIPYSYDPNGKQYPRLTPTLASPKDLERALDLDAHLDSGAERSLFDGRLAPILGINLLVGNEITFQTTAGNSLAARLHPVRVSHSLLGSFDIEVGFSTGAIARNLLGRDFLSLIQIGLRESRLTLYVTASP